MKGLMRLIYCVTFFIYSTAFSQSEIDATNVSVLKFYIPNRSYQRNKVKEVLIHFGILSNKKELVQHSFYNKDGYLEYQKIYNNNFPSDEESIVVKRNGGSFEVTRKIRKTALLNSSACIDCFWDTYYSIKNYWEADMDSFITVKSIYNFAKDSSFNYQSFINQERIDSGRMPTKFSLDRSELEARINAYTDSFFLRDTLLVRDSQKISGAVQIVTSKFFVKKLLVKTETNQYINNALDGTFIVLYRYNLNGKLSTEEQFDLNGRIFKKRFFYYKKGIIDYSIEKIYRIDGVLDISKKYDRNGQILEEVYHGVGEKISHKTIYKYFPNRLLREKIFIADDGIVKSGYTYRYLYK